MRALFRILSFTIFTLCGLLTSPARSDVAEPYEIHAILSLTGSAGFIGQNEAHAFQALENVQNAHGGLDGRPIKFVIQDDTSNPEVDVQLIGQLVAAKVPVVLGSTVFALCKAMEPLVQHGPVTYCLSNVVRPPPQSYMFSSEPVNTALIAAGLRYERLSGHHRVAMINLTDASGQDAVHNFDYLLKLPENKTLKLVDREYFNPSDLSVTAQLARIKGANPDFLIVWAAGTPAGTVLRGLVENGMAQLPIMISPANGNAQQMKQYADFLPPNVHFAIPAAMASDQVTDRSTRSADESMSAALETLGLKPDPLLIAAWDPALIVLQALHKLGSTATADQIRAYINGLRNFVGVNGHYDFRAIPQRGIGDDGIYIAKWDLAKKSWAVISKPGGVPLAAK